MSDDSSSSFWTTPRNLRIFSGCLAVSVILLVVTLFSEIQLTSGDGYSSKADIKMNERAAKYLLPRESLERKRLRNEFVAEEHLRQKRQQQQQSADAFVIDDDGDLGWDKKQPPQKASAGGKKGASTAESSSSSSLADFPGLTHAPELAERKPQASDSSELSDVIAGAASPAEVTAALLRSRSLAPESVAALKDLNNSFPLLVSSMTSVANDGPLTLKISRVASSSYSSSTTDSTLLLLLREGTGLGKQMRSCLSQYRGGMFFNFTTRQCKPHDGFFTPLKSFEVSVEELSCSPDSFYERFRNPQQQYRWVDLPFANFSNANGVLEHFGIDQSAILAAAGNIKAAAPLARRYSRWMFFTSWVMRQWLPYTPLPVKVERTTKQNSNNIDDAPVVADAQYSAFHDPSVENLYVIRNFCIAPYGGISGYRPSRVDRFRGLMDERNKFHTKDSKAWGRFAGGPARLQQPPDFFDERPVVFVPRLPFSHPNIHHTFARFVSTVGILDLPAFSNNVQEPEQFRAASNNNSSSSSTSSSSSSHPRNEFDYSGRSSTTEHWNSRQGVKPLIVLVYNGIERKRIKQTADFRRVTVHAFFLRALDLPIAIVTMGREPAGTMAALFAMTRHNASTAPGGGKFHSDGAFNSAMFCGRRAVVYQNCMAGCSWFNSQGDKEVYSFGSFARLTGERSAMLSRFVRLLRNCVPMPMPIASSASATPLQLQLPRLFFNVRSSFRTLAHLPLIAEELENGLRNFVSEIRFREPWRGSRAQYLDDIRASNIWFGGHGGAMAEVIHLPRRSVVVEMSAAPFQCRGGAPKHAPPRAAGCWFEPSIQFTQSSHWIMGLPQFAFQGRTSHMDKTLQVPAFALVAWLRDAVCAWYHNNAATRKMPNEVVRLYCKYFSPAVSVLGSLGATRYRSEQVFFDKNAPLSFAADLGAVVRCLRDEFAIEMSGGVGEARMLVERLRSLHSKLRDRQKFHERVGFLKSETPVLFEVLLQRFVDASLTVAAMPRSSSGLDSSNSKRRKSTVVETTTTTTTTTTEAPQEEEPLEQQQNASSSSDADAASGSGDDVNNITRAARPTEDPRQQNVLETVVCLEDAAGTRSCLHTLK